MRSIIVICLSIAAVLSADYPVPVPGHAPISADEHPRLLFRRADLPSIRARAATPEGAALVARLRATLGGGEALPAIESPLRVAYESSVKLPEGAWTISTPMGFGMLWQLTGERRYADLAWQALERGWAGVRDRDAAGRYALTTIDSDGHLRAGPIFGYVAMAYDLCYDGWDAQRRARIRDWLLSGSIAAARYKDGKVVDSPRTFTLAELIEKPDHHPASNHWGATFGGAWLAVLAVQGDAGVDAGRIDAWRAKLASGLRRCLTEGFGDRGFFSEGQGPSHVGSNSALLACIQALRVADGQDWAPPDSPAAWLTLRWIMETTTTPDGTAIYPIRDELFGPAYGTSRWLQMNGSFTHGGWFSAGFGAIPAADIPALLWTYNHVAAKDDGNLRDTLNYPHRAVSALVNWPLAAAEANPQQRLPRALFDRLHGYVVLRSGWKDHADVIATLFACRGPAPYGKWPKQNLAIRLIANGIMHSIPWPLTGEDPAVLRWDQRGGAVAYPNGFALGVHPGAPAGCDAVAVRTGGADRARGGPDGRILDQEAAIDGVRLAICTLSASGIHPKAVVEGASIRLGGLRVRLDGKVPVFAAEGAAGAGADAIDGFAAKGIPRPAPVRESDIVLPRDPALAYGFDPPSLHERDGVLLAAPDAGDGRQAARFTGIEVVPGVRGAAIHSGDNGFGIVPPGDGSRITHDSFSISFWFKLDEPVDGYGLFLENSPGNSGPGRFQIGWHPGPVLCFAGPGSYDAPFGNEGGRWYHQCIVADAASKQLVCYLDGEPIMRTAFSPAASAPQPLFLFGRGRDAERAANVCKHAALDELRIFKRALAHGEVIALQREPASARGNLPPIARFTASDRAILAGRPVVFDAAATRDAEGDPMTFAWDFGDGATATGSSATHAFAADGSYAVRLSVRDGAGGVGTASTGILVANRPPIARIEAMVGDPKQPPPPGEIGFDAGGSADPDGGPLAIVWDPPPLRTAGLQAFYAAPREGVLRVVCTLTDAEGGRSTATRIIARPGADGMLAASQPAELLPGVHVHVGVVDQELALAGDGSKPIGDRDFRFQEWTTAPDLDVRRVARRTFGHAQAWYGYLAVPESGTWTFAVGGRQGAALWIDGNYVVGGFFRFRAQAPREGSIALAKGLHRFRAVQWGVSAGSDPAPYFYGSWAWSGPGVALRQLAAGDLFRSPSPWEAAARGRPATIGEDIAEAWDVALPASVGAAQGTARLIEDGLGQPQVALAVDAPATARVEWSTGLGRPVSGREVRLPVRPGRYAAMARIVEENGRISVARVPYEVPGAARRSIGVRLAPASPPFADEMLGHPAQYRWNAWEKTIPSGPLLDSDGRPTSCVVSAYAVGGEGSKAASVDIADGADAQFMATGLPMAKLTLTGIPYRSYEIRVYFPGLAESAPTQAGRADPIAVFAIGGAKARLRCRWDAGTFADRFIVVDAGSEGEGNIARFGGLSGTEQTITLEKMPARRFRVAAIQVIEAP